MLRIGIVAGEVSGDFLGGQLIKEIKAQYGNVEIAGIGGPNLISQGCRSLFDMQRLSIIGILGALTRCIELLSIRRQLINYFLSEPPDIFIGIDAPEFNLKLEEVLRSHGIKVVHYISPSIWAWRRYRLKQIYRAVDLMLVVFPFELDYYERSGIPARFVGHPLAEQLDHQVDKNKARAALDIPGDKTVIGLMPGSRVNEVKQHLPIFLQTALWCRQKHKNLYFVSAAVDEGIAGTFIEAIAKICPDLPIKVFTGNAMQVMEASDLLLLASGTITLQAMFLKKPMVVAYRLSRFNYYLARILVYSPYIALPNLLAGKELVPECIQNDCNPKTLGIKLLAWLNEKDKIARLTQEFNLIHQAMNGEKKYSASAEILALLSGSE